MPPKTKKNRPRMSECEAAGMANVKRVDMVRMVRALGAEDDLAKIVRARASRDFNRQPTRAELCAAINARRQSMSRRRYLLLLGPALVALVLGAAVWRREILGILPVPKKAAVKKKNVDEEEQAPRKTPFEPTTRAGVRMLARPPQNPVVYATVAAAERERRVVLRQRALAEQRMVRIERDSRTEEIKNAQRRQKWVVKMAVAEAQVAKAKTPPERHAAVEARKAVLARATEDRILERTAASKRVREIKIATAEANAATHQADNLASVINKYDTPRMMKSGTYDTVSEEYEQPPMTIALSSMIAPVKQRRFPSVPSNDPTATRTAVKVKQPIPKSKVTKPTSQYAAPPSVTTYAQRYAAPPVVDYVVPQSMRSSASALPTVPAGKYNDFYRERISSGRQQLPAASYVQGHTSSKNVTSPPAFTASAGYGGGSSTQRLPNYRIPPNQQQHAFSTGSSLPVYGAGGGSLSRPSSSAYGVAPMRKQSQYASGNISSEYDSLPMMAQVPEGRTYATSPAAELIVGTGMGAAGYVTQRKQAPPLQYAAENPVPRKAQQQYRKMPAGGIHPSAYRESPSSGVGALAGNVAAEAQKRRGAGPMMGDG